jgi:pentatricopeptide repeat protein
MNLGSLNVMIDAYCHVEWFLDAILVFGKMVEKRCAPDALSYNNLIDWLGKNKILEEALDKEGRDGVQVRPMPWPSFFGITIWRHLLESLSLVFYCSVSSDHQKEHVHSLPLMCDMLEALL